MMMMVIMMIMITIVIIIIILIVIIYLGSTYKAQWFFSLITQYIITPWFSGYHTAQLHSIKPELRFFYAVSNPAHDVSEIDDGEDLGQFSQLEIIRLNAFRRSTIPQKQFKIIIKKRKCILLQYKH